MRTHLIAASTVGLLALVYACGSDGGSGAPVDDGGTPESGTPDASSDHADAAPSKDAASDAGPVAAAFGLDARPSNTTCLAKPRPVLDTGVALQRMWSGITFDKPVYMTQAPGDNTRFFVVQLTNAVRVFPSTAMSDADTSTFVTVPSTIGGESGFLGMAFHPKWQSNHEAYLSYTRVAVAGDPPSAAACGLGGATAYTSVISRYKSSDNGLTLDETADDIVKIGHPFYSDHNGGGLQFSPVDGMLYAGFGDGGGDNDPCGSGQDIGSPLGKMLRIDVNAGAGKYVVPSDNPFVSTPGALPEIWSHGHRNPWRWSFDRVAGDLWVGDVGANTWEEIDRVVGGGNYGWKICEGFHKNGSTTDLCATPGLLDPVVEHSRDDSGSIIGGYVYRGSAMPGLVGTYIYGDYSTGNIWALTYDANNKPTPKLIITLPATTLVSFGEGNDGELYATQLTGIISKLVPAAPPMPDTFPTLLSRTGCVDPKDSKLPAAGLLPYDVLSPLWSDGAKKERYFAIPDGAHITVGTDGDWDLPIGSVTMKTFSIGGKRIETRLFMRHDDGGWAGYTYEWNDQETDATLLPAGKVKPVNGGAQLYKFPSRSQCITCHNAATGGTIGLETAQLNRTSVYASTNRISNELATLDHIGVFAAPIGTLSSLPALPDPGGAAAVDARARSYLHANCSNCHRPGGTSQATMDLRYTTSFANTLTCNAPATEGAVQGASTLIVPGDPTHSVLSLRFRATDVNRMPPLDVSITDPTGAALLDQWITAVKTCP